MKKLHLLIITMTLMFGCTDGSKIQGKVEDKMSGQPLSGVDVSSSSPNNISPSCSVAAGSKAFFVFDCSFNNSS